MGHNRLGVLPKTGEWRQVVAMLDGAAVDPCELAAVVSTAAGKRFLALCNDGALSYAIWLLARLTAATRKPAFEEELRRLGVHVDSCTTSISIIVAVAELGDARLAVEPPAGHFGRIIALALRQTLTETIGSHSRGFWTSPLDDVRTALARYGTEVRFGELMVIFFGYMASRAMQSFIDRELAQHIGDTFAFATVADSVEFMDRLAAHGRASAHIVKQFAGDWYSKHNWLSERNISRESARGFACAALRKLQAELLLQGTKL